MSLNIAQIPVYSIQNISAQPLCMTNSTQTSLFRNLPPIYTHAFAPNHCAMHKNKASSILHVKGPPTTSYPAQQTTPFFSYLPSQPSSPISTKSFGMIKSNIRAAIDRSPLTCCAAAGTTSIISLIKSTQPSGSG